MHYEQAHWRSAKLAVALSMQVSSIARRLAYAAHVGSMLPGWKHAVDAEDLRLGDEARAG